MFENKRKRAFKKSKEASKISDQANKRAKKNFYNSVNATMSNHNLSPKKKFGILLKLMKNNKISSPQTLIEDDSPINDPKQKSNIFNSYFASKSTVTGSNDLYPRCDFFIIALLNYHLCEQGHT